MQETRLSKDDPRITRIEIAEEDYSTRYGFEPSTGEEKTFFKLCSAIFQCGETARANQALIHRSFKEDGSILTETDLAVSDAIIARLRTLYPDCNIISEETELFCDPMDCSLPGSSVHGIFQARVLEWLVISFSRGSSQPRDRTLLSCIAGRFFTPVPPGKPKNIDKTVVTVVDPIM